MAIAPFKPTGIGCTNNTINVFKITFSQATSDVPALTAYNAYDTSASTNTIFTGTTSFITPMIAATSKIAPGSAAWFPTSTVVGDTIAGTPNHLKGDTARVSLDTTALGAGNSVYFNIGYKIPYDVTPFSTMDHVLMVIYHYTGATPSLSFYANTGTEGTPIWTSIDSLSSATAPTTNNVTKIKCCDAGRGSNGDSTYRQTIPVSGVKVPDEIWMTNY